MSRRRLHLALPLCGLLLIAACATVPLTGRRELNLIPADEMLATSFQQYEQFLGENKLSSDAQATALVKKVGNNIKSAVERYFRQEGQSDRLAGYAWDFNLVKSNEVNAWCMPGGKVVFYEGILPICQDEKGIAVVMGHEVAHAIAEHGNERMSQALLTQMGGMALQAALASKPEQTQSLFMTAFGVGAQVGVLLPFSRQQETEADRLGLIFMAMAGYDPHVAVPFWQRMAAQGGGAPPEFLSTHPADETRVRNLQEFLPEALGYYRP
jgi:predicted Zn-dependent protease